MAQRHFSHNYSTLQDEICDFGLKRVYERYSAMIYRNYLNTFTVCHLIFTIVHEAAIFFVIEESKFTEPFVQVITISTSVLALVCLRPYMRAKFEYQHPLVKYIVSWTSLSLITLTDLIRNLHEFSPDMYWGRPSYAAYVIVVAYIFMPLPGFWHVILLAGFLTAIHIGAITAVILLHNQLRAGDVSLIMPEVIFLIAINIVGVYIKWRRSILWRVAFLTKRSHIEQMLICQYAKGREHKLLLNFIPEKMAIHISEDVSKRLKFSKMSMTKMSHRKSTVPTVSRKLFIESHEDVSILFADVVNYTYLTTQVDVKTLVGLLHDLFQRFDTACQKFSIMRIKFLGDCYYCVSGVPVSHPLHAVCCVEMGLAIIEHVRAVRLERNVNIDMRVGIHSGNLLAGIIGTTKWQYDVWSTDVDIANRLEQTGQPGRVHITNATLNLIESFYNYENGTTSAKADRVLQKYEIKTYLIIDRTEQMEESSDWINYLRNKEKAAEKASNTTDNKSNIPFSQIVEETNALMPREIYNLPVCRTHWYETWFVRHPRYKAEQRQEHITKHSISTIWLMFDNLEREYQYLCSPSNYSRRYAALLGFLLVNCAIISQSFNPIVQDVHLYCFFIALVFSIVLAVTIYKWRRKLLKKFVKSYRRNKSFKLASKIKAFSPLWILTQNFTMYTIMLVALLLVSLMHAMICNEEIVENDMEYIYQLLEDGVRTLCANSWTITNCFILFIALALCWPNIPYAIMIIVTGALSVGYIWMIFGSMSLTFESSFLTHRGINSVYSHLWNFIVMYVIFIVCARHLVFMSKYNFFAKIQLDKKIDDSLIVHETVKLLLHNMLPSHVVQIFLMRRDGAELFYERHRNVAVLFATIIHRTDDTKDLRVMNQVICDFDRILSMYTHPINVEKIKVINWTYMAACGFTVRRQENIPESIVRSEASRAGTIASLLNDTRRNRNLQASAYILGQNQLEDNLSESSESDESEENETEKHEKLVVYIMTSFAIELLKSIEQLNVVIQRMRDLDEPPLMLRVGISSGEIVAGIVGASVAHYDIWGDPVNMASRMDTTGVPGRIQVTESDANILSSCNVQCIYRGQTFVKGRGELPTYFVDTEETLNLVDYL